MKKVLIIGNAGSGKTTFAKALSNKIQLPLVHLDRLYWKGNWEHTAREEFDLLLQKELKKPEWIIDGNFNRTLPHRLQYCDTVFFFDFPTIICLWGITKRIFQNHGKTRDDMGGNCPEFFDKQKYTLYKNVVAFRKAHRTEYLALLQAASGVNVILFQNRHQVKKYLQAISSTD